MMMFISLRGFAFEVSTTCTGSVGEALAGTATAVAGFPAVWETVGASEPLRSFLSSSTVSERRLNAVPLGNWKEWILVSMLTL